MNKFNLFLIVLLILSVLCFGCKAGGAEFTQLIIDHHQVTSETVDALVKSIDDELKSMQFSETDQKKLNDLKSRLIYMKKSSEIIKKYQLSLFVDKELLSELYNNKLK